jgi:hypothetical protein
MATSVKPREHDARVRLSETNGRATRIVVTCEVRTPSRKRQIIHLTLGKPRVKAREARRSASRV